MTKRFLLGFIGIPSVGKTTFAKKLAKKFEDEERPTIIIGSDDIRKMIPGYNENFDPDREPIIRKITLNLIKNCLKLGFNVINDDLNYYKSMRHDLFEIASAQGCKLFSIYFKIPLEIALERNTSRGLPIPNAVIRNVHEKLDEPGAYKWDEPIEIIKSVDFGEEKEVEQIYLKIDKLMQISRQKKVRLEKSIPGISESVDKITRQLISELVSKENHEKFSKELSKLRKDFLVKAKKEKMSVKDTKRIFSGEIMEFIKKNQGEG